MSMVYPHIVGGLLWFRVKLQHGLWLWFSFLWLGVVAAAVVVCIWSAPYVLCILLHLVAVARVLTVWLSILLSWQLVMFKGRCKGFDYGLTSNKLASCCVYILRLTIGVLTTVWPCPTPKQFVVFRCRTRGCRCDYIFPTPTPYHKLSTVLFSSCFCGYNYVDILPPLLPGL